jgi:hypothetical protein
MAPDLSHLLEPDEALDVVHEATDAVVAVTNRRLLVAYSERQVALDAPFSAVRRIQLDVERGRPATMVIVPDRPGDRPQVLAIPNEHLTEAARAVAYVGMRLV